MPGVLTPRLRQAERVRRRLLGEPLPMSMAQQVAAACGAFAKSGISAVEAANAFSVALSALPPAIANMKIDHEGFPPVHPNCRCTIVPEDVNVDTSKVPFGVPF